MTGRPVIICLDPDDLIREGYEGWLKGTYLRVEVKLARDFDECTRSIADVAERKRQIVVITETACRDSSGQWATHAGAALVKWLHADYPAVACIVVAATIDKPTRDKLLQMQIPFFEKPASPAVLLPAIQDALRNGKGSANYAAQGGSTPKVGLKHD